jgi:hypothetical protein
MIPSAGLVPAVHDFGGLSRRGDKRVDTRAKTAQGTSTGAMRGARNPLVLR